MESNAKSKKILVSVTIQRRERIITVLWVLVWCLLYFATYGLHKKNSINSHKVVAERLIFLLRRKEEDLVVHRVPREWVLLEYLFQQCEQFHQKSSECVPLEILSVHPSNKRKHRDGQVDRQVFIAFEAPKRRLDGHVTVVHHERRQNHYLADVTQESVERQRRSAEVLDPNAPETRDKWYATQVSNHEKLFPLNVAAYTFEEAMTVFVELFCTRKSPMENPSLRVSGHGQQHEQNLHRGRLC